MNQTQTAIELNERQYINCIGKIIEQLPQKNRNNRLAKYIPSCINIGVINLRAVYFSTKPIKTPRVEFTH